MYIRIPEYVREQFSYKLHVQNKVSVHEQTGYNFFHTLKFTLQFLCRIKNTNNRLIYNYFVSDSCLNTQPTGSHDHKYFLPKNIRLKRALEGLLYRCYENMIEKNVVTKA